MREAATTLRFSCSFLHVKASLRNAPTVEMREMSPKSARCGPLIARSGHIDWAKNVRNVLNASSYVTSEVHNLRYAFHQ